MRQKIFFCTLALLLLAGSAVADSMAVGTINFVPFIPGEDGFIGTNVFYVTNDTNPPDQLKFTSAHLSLFLADGSTLQYDLPDLNAGEVVPGSGDPGLFSSLVFPDSTDLYPFTGATFTGVLFDPHSTWDGATLLGELSGGTGLLSAPATAAIIATLDNQQGDTGGGAEPTQVPEPASLTLVATGITGALLRVRMRSQNSSRAS